MVKKKAKNSPDEAGRGKRPDAKAAAANKPFFQPFASLEKKKVKEVPGRAPSAPKRAPDPPRPIEVERASESETFAIYMAGVRTLEGGAKRIPATASAIESPVRTMSDVDLDAPARASLRSLVTEGVRFEVTDDGRTLEGRRNDLDPRELRRLRRREFAVDGRLDLHGMNSGEARSALEAFVKKRRAEGDRVVVVVHGKGTHSSRGIAVLRGELGAWLSQGRASHEVAAFTSILAEDTEDPTLGSGALLVLLAR